MAPHRHRLGTLQIYGDYRADIRLKMANCGFALSSECPFPPRPRL
jgi:hypothetical protein